MSYANDDDEDDKKVAITAINGQPVPGRTGLTPVNSGGTITRDGQTTNYAATPRLTGLTPLNQGGSVTRNGQTASYGSSAYAPPAPAARNPSGLPVSPPAIRSGLTPPLAPATATVLTSALPTPGAPVASPTTAPAVQQKESANPLSGDGNAQPPGTTDSLPPISAVSPAPIAAPFARQMAGGLFSQRGNGVPRGRDIHAPLPIRSLFRRR